MPATVRPRRSILYMPGSNPRAMEKGRALPADGLIFDLEDAVAPDAKRDGRVEIAKALEDRSAYAWRELIVRVNGLDTPWGHADLTAMARAGADAILLPKVEGSDTVRRALHVLDLAGAPPGSRSWTACISISTMRPASPSRATRGAISASTAAR
jgi:citrate lyase subunit beta / citryl-CoA lyase